MRPQLGSPARTAAAIAGPQHGAITFAQLETAGLSRSTIKRWTARGLLHREFRGVYRLGHRAPSLEARYMAAVLACGEGAALSGLAAGFFLGLLKSRVPAPEVTTVRHRAVPGILIRRSRHHVETWIHCGIRTTTAARTIIDLAPRLPLDALARASHEAQVRQRLTAAAIDAAMLPATPGAAKLRAIFHGDAPITLSRLERIFLEVLRAKGLPLPLTNRPAGRRYVDCRWAELRLTVELDSYRYHHTRHAWEQDRRREREARGRGDEFRRYTYGDVVKDRTFMLGELRGLLLKRRR